MSIFTCAICERYVDSDFQPSYDLGDGMVCESCYDEEFEKQKNCYGCATQRHSCEHDQ